MIQIFCALSIVSAANIAQLETYPIKVGGPNDVSTTVEYAPNTNFAPCTCDLVAGSCDPYCCCDSDCPAVSFKPIII